MEIIKRDVENGIALKFEVILFGKIKIYFFSFAAMIKIVGLTKLSSFGRITHNCKQ